jgi:hypothetical protein
MDVELTEAEVFDILDLAVQQRYQSDAYEFMAAYEEGTTHRRFPGSDDLLRLAEALEGEV